jgi:hypothetical protein
MDLDRQTGADGQTDADRQMDLDRQAQPEHRTEAGSGPNEAPGSQGS